MGLSQDTPLMQAFGGARALRLADGPDEVSPGLPFAASRAFKLLVPKIPGSSRFGIFVIIGALADRGTT